MMKQAISLLLLSTFVLAVLLGNVLAGGTHGTLVVSMEGFSNSKGHAMVAVYGSEEAYKAGTPRVAEAKTDIIDQKALVTISDLEYGTYAVAIYHDQNANGKLDKNFLGIPKESYGHSNNVRGSMGPPSFDKVKLELAGSELKISIKMGK